MNLQEWKKPGVILTGLALIVTILVVPAQDITWGGQLVRDTLDYLRAETSWPRAFVFALTMLVALIGYVLGWAPWNVHKIKRVVVDAPSRPMLSFWETPEGFEPTDLQKHILRKLRDAHGKSGTRQTVGDLATKVRQEVFKVENALNKLHKANFVLDLGGSGANRQFVLSEAGLEYAAEKLDSE